MIIIYPPTVSWDFIKARPQQLMQEFAKQGDTVIFCEPEQGSNRTIKQISDRLWINYGAPQEEWPKPSLGEKKLLWVSYPGHLLKLGSYQEDIVLYDVLDLPEEEFSAWKPYVKSLIEKSQIILTVSKPLQKYFQRYHTNVHLVRNGVEYHHFSAFTNKKLSRMEDIPKPVVGYFGVLASWLDWPLIENLADRNPQISFVFIGPAIGMSKGALPQRPNLHFLGRIPYEELPGYAGYFDLCLLPFRRTEMTCYVNPVKVYEYLALGKPVVARDLPEILEMVPLVLPATDEESFSKGIQECLQCNNFKLAKERKLFAQKNSWEQRVSDIKRILESL